MNAKLVKESKRMAHALRHAPEVYGLVLDVFGRVDLNVFAKALSIPVSEVCLIVETDNKNRFGVVDGLIFCFAGHSIPVKLNLEIIENVSVLFHGTKVKFLDSILENGLISQSRNFVHVSRDVVGAQIVADRRVGDSVILKIDAEAFCREGFEVFSSGGALLVEMVPARFISVSEIDEI